MPCNRSITSNFSSSDIFVCCSLSEPDPTPKVARALGPRALEPPDVTATPVRSEDPLDVAQAAAAASVARLVAHDPGVRLGIDPEDVHQARVATRRLRSDLRTFRRVVDERWAEALRDELKWIGGLLGDVRDTDVLLDRLLHRAEELPEPDRARGHRVLGELRSHRDQARGALLDAMRSEHYVALLDRLVDAAHGVVPSASTDADAFEVATLVRKPWKTLKKLVRELGDDPPDEALHAVRIKAKRVRYAAEAVAPAVDRRAAKFARAVARLQDVLGEHQDAVTAERWLREHARAADPAEAFVAGELAALERRAADRSRARWPDAWRRARHPSLRRWL